MEDISLHILDIAENSITGGAKNVKIGVMHGKRDCGIIIEISDDGDGMNEEVSQRATDPFYTNKPGKKIGLGLSLFKQAALESGGSFNIESSSGVGTRVRAMFMTDHPDCRPLGDIKETVALLNVFHRHINFELNIEEKTNRTGRTQ